MVSLPVAVPNVRSTQFKVILVGLMSAAAHVGRFGVVGMVSVRAVALGEAVPAPTAL